MFWSCLKGVVTSGGNAICVCIASAWQGWHTHSVFLFASSRPAWSCTVLCSFAIEQTSCVYESEDEQSKNIMCVCFPFCRDMSSYRNTDVFMRWKEDWSRDFERLIAAVALPFLVKVAALIHFETCHILSFITALTGTVHHSKWLCKQLH